MFACKFLNKGQHNQSLLCLHPCCTFFEEPLLLLLLMEICCNRLSIDHVSTLSSQTYLCEAMYLVISCGSNSCPSCFGELVYVASLAFYLQMCCSALGVLSDHIVLFYFLVNKNPSGTFPNCGCLMVSVKPWIFVFSPYFLSCCPNKMTVLFTTLACPSRLSQH